MKDPIVPRPEQFHDGWATGDIPEMVKTKAERWNEVWTNPIDGKDDIANALAHLHEIAQEQELEHLTLEQ